MIRRLSVRLLLAILPHTALAVRLDFAAVPAELSSEPEGRPQEQELALKKDFKKLESRLDELDDRLMRRRDASIAARKGIFESSLREKKQSPQETTNTTSTSTTAATSTTTTSATTTTTSMSRLGLKTLEFYMYRASGGRMRYSPQNINTASAAGVMRYIHVEVIGQPACGTCSPDKNCKRKYDIDRILRFKVKMQNTPEVHKHVGNPQFGPFRQFDNAQCTFGHCPKTWQKYGYVVGCQPQSNFHYDDAVWYSLPGKCPSKPYDKKTEECKKEEPGGDCFDKSLSGVERRQNGWSRECTYEIRMDKNGVETEEVFLDELVGLGNYIDFCKKGGVEYNTEDESASTIDFWKGFTNATANKARTEALLEAFAKKYPNSPQLPMPHCDGF